ncbi:MAG: alginate lyase family protein, partial [Bacteroidota bacterium]
MLSIVFDKETIIQQAEQYLNQPPVPVTNFRAERSEGGPNDFYSEGDYWWPSPEDPDGPYIRRDGQSNPDNFNAHREAMWDLSRWVAALVAAYKVTQEEAYADQALLHLSAWFINQDTRMNPSLLYAQAIKGRVTGRGIGIIDTIHLIEVAQSIRVLHQMGYLSEEDWN